MYGSKDLNLPFPASTATYDKQGKEGSDLFPDDNQMNSGFLRYRSATTAFLHDVGCDELAPNRSTSPEPESMLARFMSKKQSTPAQRGSHSFMPTVEEENDEGPVVAPPPPPQSGNSSTFPLLFRSPVQQKDEKQRLSPAPTCALESPYRMMSSTGTADEPAKSVESSSLLRNSSSPTGLFSQLNVDDGFNMLKGMGERYRHGSASHGTEEGATGRLKCQISFSSRQGSSGFMPLTSEARTDGLGGGESSAVDGGCGLSNGSTTSGGIRRYNLGYSAATWEDSVLLSDGSCGSKRARDPSELHSGEASDHALKLTHHLSLPRNSSDMPSVEKFLQFQEAVPYKIRAKRGCATHPRSIAERVRRTKISERMRKLQELVPNMDKQTNTADMLDLAVDYVKDLQKTVQTLSDEQSRCACLSKENS